MEKLGAGCNNLTLTGSNRITGHSVSTGLELCVLEAVEGLQASIVTDGDDCPYSMDLVIGVLLEKGAPAELLFSLTGATDTLSETKYMFNGSSEIYTFSSPLEGKPVSQVHAQGGKFGSIPELDNRLSE